MKVSVSRRTLLSAALFGIGRLALPPSLFAWAETSGVERDEQWRQDLQILAQELPQRAKPLQDPHKKHAFLNRLEHLHKSVASRTDNQILVAIMQSLALIGDSHTKLPSRALLCRSIPSICTGSKRDCTPPAPETNALNCSARGCCKLATRRLGTFCGSSKPLSAMKTSGCSRAWSST